MCFLVGWECDFLDDSTYGTIWMIPYYKWFISIGVILSAGTRTFFHKYLFFLPVWVQGEAWRRFWIWFPLCKIWSRVPNEGWRPPSSSDWCWPIGTRWWSPHLPSSHPSLPSQSLHPRSRTKKQGVAQHVRRF